MHTTYDAVIAGGGLAGLTLARQLHMEAPHVRVLVLEKRLHPVREAAFKVGESSVEIGAHYFRSVLGLEPVLRSQHLEKLGLRYFFPQGSNDDISRRTELGPPAFPTVPSFQLDRGRLENWLLASVRDSGVEVIDDCAVKRIELKRGAHTVEFAGPGGSGSVQARWLVDASGRCRPDPASARADTGGDARRQRRVVPRQGRESRSTTGRAIRRGRRGCRPVSAG